MNRAWARLVLYMLLVCAEPIRAQQVPAVHFTVDEGLPSNTVYSAYLDHKGFLWFATDKGVARYNGLKFETFTTFNGLPDNEVFFFHEDDYGRLWLGAFNGELCYFKNDTFHTAANTPFLRIPVKTSFVNDVRDEKDSSITFGFFENTTLLNIGKEHCTVVKLDKIYPPELKVQEEKISQLHYRIITTDSVIEVSSLGEKMSSRPVMAILHLKDTLVKGIYLQDKRYIIGRHHIYDEAFRPVGTLHLESNIKYSLHTVYQNSSGYFVATDKGLYINDSIRLFPDEIVSSLTEDNQHHYWATTLTHGVYEFGPDFATSRLYKGAYHNQIKYVYHDSRRLFFVTVQGDVFSLEKGSIHDVFRFTDFFGKNKAAELDMSCYIDSNLHYYETDDNCFFTIDNLLSPKKSIRILLPHVGFGHRELYRYKDYLVGWTATAVIRYDVGHQHTGKNLSPDYIYTNVSRRLYDFTQAPDGSFWFSDVNDLYKFDVASWKPVLQQRFKNIGIKYLGFAGKFLVGYTHNNQLFVCADYNGKARLEQVPSQNCIWDKIYDLDKHHVLISTNNQYRLLTLNDTLGGKLWSIAVIENPFIPLNPEWISTNGTRCCFFKNGDITEVDISTLLRAPEPPDMTFGLLKMGKKTLHILPEMEIDYPESRNLAITFLARSFGGRGISYQYSISKTETDNWRDIVGQINLVDASSGTYYIKLRAKTLSTGYGNPAVFRLVILQPFWDSWWFITLCIIAGSGLLFSGFRLRLRYLVRRKEREHNREVKFMKSEYKALNALMNPHFIFNTLNNVQSLVNEDNKLAANEYLRIFADLIRQNMQNVSKELISLKKEMDLVTNYLLLEKLRFEERLNYSINIAPQIDLDDILVPPLLIQPLVENAIKHGILPLKDGQGIVVINIEERDEKIYIEVKDNGVGLSAASASPSHDTHESFGINNIRQRIEQLGVILGKKITFEIREKPDTYGQQWTEAIIVIPA